MKHLSYILFLTMLGLSAFGQENTVYIPFRVGDKWTVANEAGEMLFEATFEEIFPSSVNRIRFRQNGRYGFINPEGEVVIEPTYQEATDFEYFGGKTYSHVTLADTSFYIDINGNTVKPNYGCGGVFHNYPNGLTVFESDGKVGVISFGNDTVILPTFKHIKNYNNGELVIAQNFDEKYGIISSRGDTLFGFSLDSVVYYQVNFGIQYYQIFENEKVGAIDIGGNIQAYPRYDELTPYSAYRRFYFRATRDGSKLGYVYNGIEFWK